MKDDVLFDHEKFQLAFGDANARRVEYLAAQTRRAAGAVRWKGLGAVVGSVFALFVGHTINTPAAPGQSSDHGTVSRD
jgi:hypothetical protein